MKADQDVVITTIYVVIDTICQKMLSTPPQKTKDDGFRNSDHCRLFGAIF